MSQELKPGDNLPRRFATLKNTCKLYNHVFEREASLRHYVFHAHNNGLYTAISKLGKKIIFDLDKLDEWISRGYEDK